MTTTTGPRRRSPKTGRYLSKLTPALTEKLCEQLRRGHYVEPACAAVGIHRDTYHTWREQGLDALALREEGRPVPARQKPFLAFHDATEEARAYGEWWLVEQALEAAEAKRPTWTAYVTILERSRRERWRRPSATELTEQRAASGSRGQTPLDLSKLSREERGQLRDLLLQMVSPPDGD